LEAHGFELVAGNWALSAQSPKKVRENFLTPHFASDISLVTVSYHFIARAIVSSL
jgi:hypothetical protein